MKRLFVASILLLFIAGPALGQPTSNPTTDPATKVEPATKSSAPATPGEEKKDEPKGEEKKPAGEESKATTGEGTQSWWEAGLAELMKLVFVILGIMAMALVRVLMKKFGFEEQSAKVNDLLTKAIGYAEQKALKASKLEEGKKTSGAEKMELAVNFAKNMAKEYNLPDKGTDWWEDKLESWLGTKNGS